MPTPQGDVMYSCPGGMDFASSFSSDGELAILRMPGQPNIELSRQVSGLGICLFGLLTTSCAAVVARRHSPPRDARCAVTPPAGSGEPPRTFEGGGITVTLFPDGTFRLREKREGSAEPLLDLGQWAQEVEGGVRLVLRGGEGSRRSFREIGVGKLVTDNGTELLRTANPDPIDGKFRLSGMYRDAQDGGLFAACLVGRTYGVAPGGAEPDLEKAWVNMTPSQASSLYVEIIGGFDDNNSVTVDRFINVKRERRLPVAGVARIERCATPNGALSS